MKMPTMFAAPIGIRSITVTLSEWAMWCGAVHEIHRFGG